MCSPILNSDLAGGFLTEGAGAGAAAIGPGWDAATGATFAAGAGTRAGFATTGFAEAAAAAGGFFCGAAAFCGATVAATVFFGACACDAAAGFFAAALATGFAGCFFTCFDLLDAAIAGLAGFRLVLATVFFWGAFARLGLALFDLLDIFFPCLHAALARVAT